MNWRMWKSLPLRELPASKPPAEVGIEPLRRARHQTTGMMVTSSFISIGRDQERLAAPPGWLAPLDERHFSPTTPDAGPSAEDTGHATLGAVDRRTDGARARRGELLVPPPRGGLLSACAGRCAGRDVLEAGCGEGYGADLLAGVARRRGSAWTTTSRAVAHVRARYPRVEMLHGNLAAPAAGRRCRRRRRQLPGDRTPVGPGPVRRRMPSGVAAGGVLLMSTPNRITFSPAATPRSTRSTPVNSTRVTN